MAKNPKKNFFPAVVFLLFGIIGIGMLIGGFILLGSSLRFRGTAVEVTATIVEIQARQRSDGDVTHTAYVDYSYEGQSFEHAALGYYSSSMFVGKEIPLLVDPQQPGHMTSASGDVLGYGILLGMGVIFVLVGFIPMICMTVSSLKGKKLLETGKRLSATVERIDLNLSVTYNGRHPYIIFCTYQDVYKDLIYRFKSKNLMREPGCAPGDSIEVYVDPEDYSKYVVNVDSLANPRVIDFT